MIYDTDMLIWIQRGNPKAARIIEKDSDRHLSIQAYMELLQGARNKREQAHIKDFLWSFAFTIVPLSEDIGHRALIYVEEYALATGLRSADALIAATAVESHQKLVSSNVKHFRAIKELQLHAFRP